MSSLCLCACEWVCVLVCLWVCVQSMCMCVCVWKVRDCTGSIVVLFNTVWDGLSSSVTGLRLVLSGRPLHSLTDFWQLRWVYCVLSPLNVQTPAPRLGLRRLLSWSCVMCYCRLLHSVATGSWAHLTNKYYYDNSFSVLTLHSFLSFFFLHSNFSLCRVNTLLAHSSLWVSL